MFLGREKELNNLNNMYQRKGNQIVVLYGMKQIGKTTLIQHFLKDKPSHIYHAKSCSEREQTFQWSNDLNLKGLVEYPEYRDILQVIFSCNEAQLQGSKKQILVIEKFEFILKDNLTFFRQLIDVLEEIKEKQEVLVIFTSAAVRWVEQTFLDKMKEDIHHLTAFMKLQELKFQHIVQYFPQFSRQESMQLYAILGGVPGLLSCLDPSIGFMENVIKYVLPEKGYIAQYSKLIIAYELRETGVYNTILSALARKHNKLNDLYKETGFSRAKISVYLKNLMELGVVKKIDSFGGNNENTQKGMYAFKHHFLHFYFTVIFPNENQWSILDRPTFYYKYVAPALSSYVQDYFAIICSEYLEQLKEHHKLPIHYTHSGTWMGKRGTIDMVLEDESQQRIAAFCNYKKSVMTYDYYEQYLNIIKDSNLSIDYIYLFSMHRFDERLSAEAKNINNLTLVSIKG